MAVFKDEAPPVDFRVRELLQVALAVLGTIKLRPTVASAEQAMTAFDNVRNLAAEMIKEGTATHAMLALFDRWEKRYVDSQHVSDTATDDIKRLSEQITAACFQFDHCTEQLILIYAKVFGWRFALLLEAVNGLQLVTDENHKAALEQLALISNELLQLVPETEE